MRRSIANLLIAGSVYNVEPNGPREDPYVLVYDHKVTNGKVVRVLTMHRPRKFNAWTEPMLRSMQTAFMKAEEDPMVHGLVVTGSGNYYCAGVHLAGTLKIAAPSKLREEIFRGNKSVFEAFLLFKKPLVVAANGPAIGASVTSATLCDGIICCSAATFSTPFYRLGVTPEGCSSVMFERLMGKSIAERMLGKEGYTPDGPDAVKIGLAIKCVPNVDLPSLRIAPGTVKISADQFLAERPMTSLVSEAIDYVSNVDPKARKIAGKFLRTEGLVSELVEVNIRESRDLAQAFTSARFLKAQEDFAYSKKRTGQALAFKVARTTRPLWNLF